MDESASRGKSLWSERNQCPPSTLASFTSSFPITITTDHHLLSGLPTPIFSFLHLASVDNGSSLHLVATSPAACKSHSARVHSSFANSNHRLPRPARTEPAPFTRLHSVLDARRKSRIWVGCGICSHASYEDRRTPRRLAGSEKLVLLRSGRNGAPAPPRSREASLPATPQALEQVTAHGQWGASRCQSMRQDNDAVMVNHSVHAQEAWDRVPGARGREF